MAWGCLQSLESAKHDRGERIARLRLHAIRIHNPMKLLLAAPVAPTESLAAMCEDANELVCLEDYELFGVLGFYYRDFRQISNEEAIEMLGRFPAQKLQEARSPAA
jgi:predicted phosphoribosyltransferase